VVGSCEDSHETSIPIKCEESDFLRNYSGMGKSFLPSGFVHCDESPPQKLKPSYDIYLCSSHHSSSLHKNHKILEMGSVSCFR
jgi:hypothetical protein